MNKINGCLLKEVIEGCDLSMFQNFDAAAAKREMLAKKTRECALKNKVCLWIIVTLYN
jgi:hypothetical protein